MLSAAISPASGWRAGMMLWYSVTTHSHFMLNLNLTSLYHWNFHLPKIHMLIQSYLAFLWHSIICLFIYHLVKQRKKFFCQDPLPLGSREDRDYKCLYFKQCAPLRKQSQIRSRYRESIFERDREDTWAIFLVFLLDSSCIIQEFLYYFPSKYLPLNMQLTP